MDSDNWRLVRYCWSYRDDENETMLFSQMMPLYKRLWKGGGEKAMECIERMEKTKKVTMLLFVKKVVKRVFIVEF